MKLIRRRFTALFFRRCRCLLPVAVLAAVFFAGPSKIGEAIAEAPNRSAAASDTASAVAVADEHPYPLHVAAPSLDGGELVNTAKPVTISELRGRFVLLDFWTFCCINCMHVLPELKKVEHAFPEEVVVVGIHSPKFAGEQVTENIREAALRYEIEHPVVNDSKMAIWRRYGARAWPTLVLIDPAGDVVWAASGERTFEQVKEVIDRGLPYYRAKGLLKPAPRPALVLDQTANQTPLRFPGKVLADEAGGRLFIADSNHNRIVVASFDGKLQQIIGSGAIGRAEGGFDVCSFNHPQGMALSGNVLYIADTQNHLLRKADLVSRQLTTIAGTGEKGDRFRIGTNPQPAVRNPQSALLSTALSSPWALWVHKSELFVAMAGTHQIWWMSLDEKTIRPYAGDGREDIEDGALSQASFAQPSGLTSDGTRLFVADSEGSTVRAVPLDGAGQVETLISLTGTLFDFGDVDGSGRDVRLQHPLGVAWSKGLLYVADTYNNKIKVIDVNSHSCRTVAGSGPAGNDDADAGATAKFSEPAGLSAAGGKLYVADTNNHSIRIVELKPPYRVTTFKIDGLTPPTRTN